MQLRKGGLNIFHQQVAGYVIGHGNGQHGQAAAQQAHNHVAGGRHQRAAVLPAHDQGAGGQRHDLDKHVAGKQVVGVEHGHHGRQHQIQHYAYQVLLAVVHLLLQLAHAAQHAQHQDQAEAHRQHAFQYARADLVAPRGGKVTHQVHIALAVLRQKNAEPHIQRSHHATQGNRYPSGRAAGQHGAYNAADHAQHNGEERYVLHKLHFSRPLLS